MPYYYLKIGILLTVPLVLSLYGCSYSAPYSDAEYGCGINYADQSLRWTLLERPPENSEELLALAKDGRTAANFLSIGEVLPNEFWFRRGEELLVCRINNSSSCFDRAGKTVKFDRDDSWEVTEMGELVCLS